MPKIFLTFSSLVMTVMARKIGRQNHLVEILKLFFTLIGVLIFIWAAHIYLDEANLYPQIAHFFSRKERNGFEQRDDLIEEIPNIKTNSRVELMQSSAIVDPQHPQQIECTDQVESVIEGQIQEQMIK